MTKFLYKISPRLAKATKRKKKKTKQKKGEKTITQHPPKSTLFLLQVSRHSSGNAQTPQMRHECINQKNPDMNEHIQPYSSALCVLD